MMNIQFPDTLNIRVVAEEGKPVEYVDSQGGFIETDKNATEMHVEWVYNRLVIHRKVQDGYEPGYSAIRIEIIGLSEEPLSIKVDDAAAPVWYYENNIVELRVDSFEKIQVTTQIGHSDETIVSRPPDL